MPDTDQTTVIAVGSRWRNRYTQREATVLGTDALPPHDVAERYRHAFTAPRIWLDDLPWHGWKPEEFVSCWEQVL